MAAINSAFDRFRKIEEADKKCKLRANGYFIENHVSSTEVKVVRTDKNIKAVLIFGHEEGSDNVIFYSYPDADVQTGDYFIWETKHFIVFEDTYIVMEAGYKKQKAIECNTIANTDIPVAFLGSMRSYKNNRLVDNFVESKLNPAIIAPVGKFLIGDRIIINNCSWEIIDGDLVSNPNVHYFYLDRRLKDTTVQTIPSEDANVIYAGSTLTVPCDNGQFSSTPSVEIKSRTLNSAVIKVPYGITALQITANVESVETISNYVVRGG